LKLLGEGKVYSKKDLVLKEEEAVGNVAYAPNLSTAAMTANQQAAKTPANKVQVISGGDLGNKNGQTRDVKVGFNTHDVNARHEVEQMVNKSNNPDKIDVVMDTNPLTQSSDGSTLDEMRANSVPFTKKELTAFLKSL
jgi:hypothetical protein